MTGIASQRRPDTKVRCSKSREVHWLDLFEYAPMVKKSDRISGYETTQRVSSDAEFLDVVTILLQFFKSRLNLVGNAFATKLNAVVGEAAGVALRNQDVEVGKSLTNAGSKELQVVRLAPKSKNRQNNTLS